MDKIKSELLAQSPPLPRGQRRTKHVMLTLSDEEHARLVGAAAALGWAPSPLARTLVMTGLVAIPSPEEREDAVKSPPLGLHHKGVEEAQQARKEAEHRESVARRLRQAEEAEARSKDLLPKKIPEVEPLPRRRV